MVEAKKLVDKYTSYFLFWENMFENGMTESDKIYLAIENTNPSNIDFICSEAFPQATKTEYGEFILEKDNFYGACFDNEDSIYKIYSYDSLNKTYKQLFGNEKDLPKQLVSVVWSRYAYSEKYNAYIELSCECGGAPYPTSYYDVASAIEKKDTLEVLVNYVTFSFNEYNKTYYSKLNSNINISIDDPHDLTTEQIENLYNKSVNADSILEYKFNFKKSESGYYLDSIIKQTY